MRQFCATKSSILTIAAAPENLLCNDRLAYSSAGRTPAISSTGKRGIPVLEHREHGV
jgi:hypothetical protein